ncbi:CocE/NonD family hydrolase [Synechocystis sp. PCC 7339]|uniref:CocE/NonD family hydrolase n=1 Tax=Synechocystis sp. PCC 7339 TaxID=2782213 RepID=UPI001CBC0270|nr:CocE/NonD family hydrolase [Synechocystis sp. PCC 7339]UAJ72812.1 CocE/NonD family hydrolase [Synechocystis sp. PCC 7339]
MVTRDGIRLDSNLYYPNSGGPWPALLMRQPYGRRLASTLVYAHPHWYASQGYLVVIQDVRGRGSSEGEFDLFAYEVEDGQDCLDWLSQLPQCDGSVAMYGFSYQGMTQLYAAANHHPCLKTICPAMVAWDLYEDWGYENGAFCLQNNLGWALQLAADSAKRRGDGKSFQQLMRLARSYDFTDRQPAIPDRLGELAPDSFYHQWISQPPESDYWHRQSPDQRWQIREKIDIPVLQIGGWFDPHLRGNLRLYAELERCDIKQKMVVGPWGHFPWGSRAGGQNYGESAISGVDQLQLAWFDHFLKGQEPRFNPAKLELFDLGTKQWRFLPDWPGTEQRWFLQCSGLGTTQGSALTTKAPAKLAEEISDVWVHDPWRPVPSLGGHSGYPQGVKERSAIDDRSDVLTYTYEPLQESLTICGVPQIFLTVASDRPSFDVAVSLSQVNNRGEVWAVSHGYCTSVEEQATLAIPLQAICATLAIGDRLRISLAGASFPAYGVNPGTGQKAVFANLVDQQIITLALTTNSTTENYLLLPILPGT